MYRPRLTKEVHRTTSGRRYERGKTRDIIISLIPPALVGFTLQGTRQMFLLDAEVGYEIAIKRFMQDVEREAKKLKKDEGITIAAARSKVRKLLLRKR